MNAPHKTQTTLVTGVQNQQVPASEILVLVEGHSQPETLGEALASGGAGGVTSIESADANIGVDPSTGDVVLTLSPILTNMENFVSVAGVGLLIEALASANSGDISIFTENVVGAGTSGNIVITTGNSGTASPGNILVTAGISSGQPGGDIILTAGKFNKQNIGAFVEAAGGTSFAGGDATVRGGNASAAEADGGPVILTGGAAADGNGGGVALNPGTGTTSNGEVTVNTIPIFDIAGNPVFAGSSQVAIVGTQFDKTNDTTLADVTDLTANVEAGGVYTFEAVLFTVSNIGTGVKAAISGGCTATSIIYEGTTYSAGVSVASAAARTTTKGNAVGGITAITVARIDITGTIVVLAAGTLTVQFAENAAIALTVSSVLINSKFTVTRVA